MSEWGLYDEKRGAWLIGHGGVPWRTTRVPAHAKVVDLAQYDGPPEWEARKHPIPIAEMAAKHDHREIDGCPVCDVKSPSQAFAHAKSADPRYARCTCASIQRTDVSRHFRECPMRAAYPE